MSRQEFPRAVKVECIKDATRGGVIYCDVCSLPAKKFQVDHIIADAHGGKPVRENAQIICEPCYLVKNAKDTTIAAKLKRVQAKHIGATKPKGTLRGPSFPAGKPKPQKLEMPPRRPMFVGE